MMADMLFTAEGVTKKFGGVTALDNVSMSIRRNSIFGLIGPNGAGKTTFFNTLTGLYQVDGGKFTFDDSRMRLLRSASRAPSRIFACSAKCQCSRT